MLFIFPSILFFACIPVLKNNYIQLYGKKSYQKCFAIFMVWGTSGLKQKYMPSTKSLLFQLKEKQLLAILNSFCPTKTL